MLLSGGVDSTVLVADRINRGHEVHAVGFDYGQTHIRELHSAHLIAQHYEIPFRAILLEGLSGSALTGERVIPDGHADTVDDTYVPGRNIVMLATAISIAEQLDASNVSFGANKDDFGGYPDCRPDFIHHMDMAACVSAKISVTAPFQAWTKRQVIDHGRQLKAPLHLCWSCYRGEDIPCGMCGACVSLQEAECA